MNTEKMTVHEALSTLKMLDKRINRAINEFVPVKANKHSNAKIDGKTVKQYEADIVSAYDSITAMITRRNAIKRAVIYSNATTEIEVCGTKMTVAEAIEMKQHSNNYSVLMMDRMNLRFATENAIFERENGDKLSDKADSYVTSLYGAKEKNVSSETADAARKIYLEANSYDLIDPLKASDMIKKTREMIDNFNTEFDSKLSVSNAVTIIEVTY